jgi:anti-anti-sigma factor
MSVPGGRNGRTEDDRWGGHVLSLEDDEKKRNRDLADWVTQGLARGEKVIYTEAPGVALPLLRILSRKGVDVGAAVTSGQLEILPLPAFYPEEGQRLVVERALDQGFQRVRMSAEAGSALTYLSADRYRQVEAAMEELCRTRPVSALCRYEAGSVCDRSLAALAAVHSGGLRARWLTTRPADDTLVLVGEVDVSNQSVLQAALLCATAATDAGTLRLDCRELWFIGVGGWRALHAGTERLRAAGGLVVLLRPPPVVARTLEMLGLGDGMSIVPAPYEP